MITVTLCTCAEKIYEADFWCNSDFRMRVQSTEYKNRFRLAANKGNRKVSGGNLSPLVALPQCNLYWRKVPSLHCRIIDIVQENDSRCDWRLLSWILYLQIHSLDFFARYRFRDATGCVRKRKGRTLWSCQLWEWLLHNNCNIQSTIIGL